MPCYLASCSGSRFCSSCRAPSRSEEAPLPLPGPVPRPGGLPSPAELCPRLPLGHRRWRGVPPSSLYSPGAPGSPLAAVPQVIPGPSVCQYLLGAWLCLPRDASRGEGSTTPPGACPLVPCPRRASASLVVIGVGRGCGSSGPDSFGFFGPAGILRGPPGPGPLPVPVTGRFPHSTNLVYFRGSVLLRSSPPGLPCVAALPVRPRPSLRPGGAVWPLLAPVAVGAVASRRLRARCPVVGVAPRRWCAPAPLHVRGISASP